MPTFKYTFEVIIEAEEIDEADDQVNALKEFMYYGDRATVVHVDVTFEDGGEY